MVQRDYWKTDGIVGTIEDVMSRCAKVVKGITDSGIKKYTLHHILNTVHSSGLNDYG